VLLAACASPTTATPTQSASSATATASARSAAPTATATARLTLADCPPPRDIHNLTVLHRFSVSPDDIAASPDGRLLVTALSADLLISTSAAGAVITTQHISGGPEGVAVDTSSVYVAQQRLNAVVALSPAVHTIASFPNHTNSLGIDGIAVDATARRLLVPDSPTGELFAVALAGSATPQLIASGLGRPVAATTDAAGDVIVASESSPGLTLITPAGTRSALGHFTDLDEVVSQSDLLYVTELDRHDMVAVDPATGATAVLATNLPAPQGLAITAAGTLEIVDATTNTMYSTPACGTAR
jgi:sugar lactone lactonase YvrE